LLNLNNLYWHLLCKACGFRTMKHFFIVLLFVMAGRVWAHKLIPGYYITPHGDTVKASFEIPFGFYSQGSQYTRLAKSPKFYKIKDGVWYRDSANKRLFLDPDSAQEFCFFYKRKTFRMLSVHYNYLQTNKFNHYEMTLKTGKGFYYLLVDGNMRLCFEYDYLASSYYTGVTKRMTQMILWKKNGNPYSYDLKTGVSKRFIDYFSDCPEARQKILRPDTSVIIVGRIARAYNTNCPELAPPDEKDYNLPDFHQSKSRAIDTLLIRHKYQVITPIDEEKNFSNEKFSAQLDVPVKRKYAWSLPLTDIVQNKIVDDLNMAKKTGPLVDSLSIQPVIEVFFSVNTGALPFISKTQAKVRIRFIVKNSAQQEVFSKSYETFYDNTDTDFEYEGRSSIAPPWEPPNIVMGMCLRKTLDKFYTDLLHLP